MLTSLAKNSLVIGIFLLGIFRFSFAETFVEKTVHGHSVSVFLENKKKSHIQVGSFSAKVERKELLFLLEICEEEVDESDEEGKTFKPAGHFTSHFVSLPFSSAYCLLNHHESACIVLAQQAVFSKVTRRHYLHNRVFRI